MQILDIVGGTVFFFLLPWLVLGLVGGAKLDELSLIVLIVSLLWVFWVARRAFKRFK